MQVVLNKSPSIAYDKNAYISLLEQGYALPIETRNNATVLLFKDVEDHVDGNGLAILWMLDGEGTFFYDGDSAALKKGDVVIFDDNTAHGFESADYCLAVNFSIGFIQECSTTLLNETLDAFVKAHHNNFQCTGLTPNF